MLDLLSHLAFGEIYRKFSRRAYSRTVSYGLRRDLSIPFNPVPAKIPLSIRPIVSRDIPLILETRGPGISKEDVVDELERMSLLREEVPTCYVAVKQDDTPCYMQWLFGSVSNDFIQRRFRHIFPILAPDEALLENAYTPAAYRGMGIMAYGMALVAKEAEKFHARYVITFVKFDNIPSLKGCKKAGFVPYLLREDVWILGRRKITFTPLPEGSPYPFDTADKTPSGKDGGIKTLSARELTNQ
jgi:hypothetical protein